MTRLILAVALGSGVGGVSRLLLSGYLQQNLHTSFPVGTLLVNISGSFLLGILLTYSLASPNISPEMRALLTTGFCGGYTTFSTFSFETATLIQGARYERAVLYILLSVAVSLAGTFAGFEAGKRLAVKHQVQQSGQHENPGRK